MDLIYLDPPFNSNASYNVLFKGPSGQDSAAQIEAFDDTWHWNDSAEAAFGEVLRSGNGNAAEMLRAMRSFLGENDMMAYLAMMAVRLLELHRVLKPTGSLYLHCDPTASHYLKILLDAVFGAKNFGNEIVWRRTGSHNSTKSFGRLHDTILGYRKSTKYTFHVIRRPYMKGHVESRYSVGEDGRARFTSGGNVLTGAGATGGASCNPWRGFDPASKGRHWAIPKFYEDLMDASYLELNPTEKLEALYQAGLVEIKEGNSWPIMVRYLEERDGTPLGDIWAFQPYTQGTVWNSEFGIDEDVKWLGPTDPERLGYPTQKPVALLERIVSASSNPGDVVLDPFCGCGTTVHAAEKLGRQWVGIDVTHLAIGLIEKRLRDAFEGVEFTTHGVPQDIEAARDLARRGRDDKNYYFEFEKWALSLIAAQPGNLSKKGADRGIDGNIYFGKTSRAIVSVKAGDNVGVAMIRDLRGVIERERADIGIFLTLTEPTKPMISEAAGAGQFELDGFEPVPRLQIVTIEEALQLRDRAVRLPARRDDAFRKAAREEGDKQGKFEL